MIGWEGRAPARPTRPRLDPAAVSCLQIAPLAAALIFFLGLPLLIILVVSFWEYANYQTSPAFQIGNYVELLTWDLTYELYGRTITNALLVWAITLVLGFSVAYFLAFHVRTFKWQLTCFLLCTIPFWTSNVIRMISWIPLLGRNGLVNQGLTTLGLIDEPLEFLLFSRVSVIIAYVHLFTLFMIVPIFNSMVRIDRSLIEAAVDAGARPWQVVKEVVVPLSRSGIAIGSILVLTLVMGDFFVVSVMSGGISASVVSALQNEISLLQYPHAGASAVVLTVVVLLMVATILRLTDIRRELAASGTTGGLRGAVRGRRPWTFYALAMAFVSFVVFLYGPMSTIYILSFQGPNGGMTFPMNGMSLHWFEAVLTQERTGDIAGAFRRSLALSLMVMICTVVLSILAGLAFRRRFPGGGAVFYLAIASLIVPGLLVGLGIGLMFEFLGVPMAWYSSALGAQLTWTLPCGLLIMFAVFSRFNRTYEEAARDLGAGPWRTVMHVVLPIILPGIIAVALFGFTLSYDELPRTILTVGARNTLPLEIWAMTTTVTSPALYAVGTLTTAVSFGAILTAFVAISVLERRRKALGRPMEPSVAANGMAQASP